LDATEISPIPLNEATDSGDLRSITESAGEADPILKEKPPEPIVPKLALEPTVLPFGPVVVVEAVVGAANENPDVVLAGILV
jgi:hypothetical protein